ncbi:hypothetical protein [Chitinophaga arvensicola]|uniref:Uncharacterized protein n=1 Tax=Chitinophaga arvensicola TaxID=29529 RepID=A0A1I0PRC5_9BACT|nr:hypothetical protein [Chitinophaga arvensicola]SEW16946.1 hypothetical protein SAMN04488122_0930 [Chitinophaga arvensicola]
MKFLPLLVLTLFYCSSHVKTPEQNDNTPALAKVNVVPEVEAYDLFDRLILFARAIGIHNKPAIMDARDTLTGEVGKGLLFRCWYHKSFFEYKYDSVNKRLKSLVPLVNNFVLDDSIAYFKYIFFLLRDDKEEFYNRSIHVTLSPDLSINDSNTLEKRITAFLPLIAPATAESYGTKLTFFQKTSWPSTMMMEKWFFDVDQHIAPLAYVDFMFHHRVFDTLSFNFENIDEMGTRRIFKYEHPRNDVLFTSLRDTLNMERGFATRYPPRY